MSPDPSLFPYESILSAILNRIDSRRFAILGKVILDHYVYGRAERLSAEAPIPIFGAERESNHLGGAANLANNLFALGKGGALQRGGAGR